MKRKQAKPVNKTEQLKKVISDGLHILRDFRNVLFASNQDEYAELKSKAGANDLVFLEEKQYSKEKALIVDAKGAILEDTEKPESSDSSKIEAVKQPKNGLSREQLHRLFLEAERKRMFAEEKIALEQRSRAILWNKMQQSLPPL